jgi:hypothetical protein
MPRFEGRGEPLLSDEDRMHASSLITMALLFGASEQGAPGVPRLPAPRPEGYGVHLSKAERRGKTPAELQRLRAQRAAGI